MQEDETVVLSLGEDDDGVSSDDDDVFNNDDDDEGVDSARWWWFSIEATEGETVAVSLGEQGPSWNPANEELLVTHFDIFHTFNFQFCLEKKHIFQVFKITADNEALLSE